MAKPASNSGASARVGPGDPSAGGDAAIAVGPSGTRAAVAAAKADDTATLLISRSAQSAHADCGEAVCGPPGGAAAPPEKDSALVEVRSVGRDWPTPQNLSHLTRGEGPHEGRVKNLPQKSPELRLGAGPSNWLQIHQDNGMPPSTGEMRGGGTALAPLLLGPRQRVAAAPQPGPAARSSPKGVATSTIAALETSAGLCTDGLDGLDEMPDEGGAARRGAGSRDTHDVVMEGNERDQHAEEAPAAAARVTSGDPIAAHDTDPARGMGRQACGFEPPPSVDAANGNGCESDIMERDTDDVKKPQQRRHDNGAGPEAGRARQQPSTRRQLLDVLRGTPRAARSPVAEMDGIDQRARLVSGKEASSGEAAAKTPPLESLVGDTRASKWQREYADLPHVDRPSVMSRWQLLRELAGGSSKGHADHIASSASSGTGAASGGSGQLERHQPRCHRGPHERAHVGDDRRPRDHRSRHEQGGLDAAAPRPEGDRDGWQQVRDPPGVDAPRRGSTQGPTARRSQHDRLDQSSFTLTCESSSLAPSSVDNAPTSPGGGNSPGGLVGIPSLASPLQRPPAPRRLRDAAAEPPAKIARLRRDSRPHRGVVHGLDVAAAAVQVAHAGEEEKGACFPNIFDGARGAEACGDYRIRHAAVGGGLQQQQIRGRRPPLGAQRLSHGAGRGGADGSGGDSFSRPASEFGALDQGHQNSRPTGSLAAAGVGGGHVGQMGAGESTAAAHSAALAAWHSVGSDDPACSSEGR